MSVNAVFISGTTLASKRAWTSKSALSASGAIKDKVVILAEAYKKSEQLRGEGDAEATAIYAEAYSVDPEFYEFTRSLKAYTETFQNKSDVMLIDSESEFFKYLNKQSQP